MKDYYSILGVPRDSSIREIKRAYKKSVRKWHPDFHPEDAVCRTRIQEVNEAFEILSDPEKRQAYDQQIEEVRRTGSGSAEFYPAHEGHPFFSYFLKMSEVLRKKNQK